MILVRHGNAGSKATWPRADELRPLSDLGLAQARSLVGTLAAEDITVVWCSPSVRCQQTAEPLAAAHGLPVRTSAYLSKTADPARLLAWLQDIGANAPVVVCTHGEVLTALYIAARKAGIVEVATRDQTAKGALWRLSAHPHRPGGPLQLAYTPPTPGSLTSRKVHPALRGALTAATRTAVDREPRREAGERDAGERDSLDADPVGGALEPAQPGPHQHLPAARAGVPPA